MTRHKINLNGGISAVKIPASMHAAEMLINLPNLAEFEQNIMKTPSFQHTSVEIAILFHPDSWH